MNFLSILNFWKMTLFPNPICQKIKKNRPLGMMLHEIVYIPDKREKSKADWMEAC